jgi:hypothetical protein
MDTKKPNLLKNPFRRIGILFGLVISLFITVALFYGLVQYADFVSPYFWMAVGIEVVFSFIIFIPDAFILRLVLFAVAVVSPVALASSFHFLWPIRGAYFVVFIVGFWIVVIKRLKHTRSSNLNNKIPDNFITPSYLPSKYVETDVRRYRKNGSQFIALIYQNDLNEHILWIKESQGPLRETKANKNTRLLNTIINGIPVVIEQKLRKQLKSSHSERTEPEFVEANWAFKRLNYNLRADGLPIEEVEKIIESMITGK